MNALDSGKNKDSDGLFKRDKREREVMKHCSFKPKVVSGDRGKAIQPKGAIADRQNEWVKDRSVLCDAL